MRLRPGGTPEICFKRPYRDANTVLTHLPSIKMLGYYHASLRDANAGRRPALLSSNRALRATFVSSRLRLAWIGSYHDLLLRTMNASKTTTSH